MLVYKLSQAGQARRTATPLDHSHTCPLSNKINESKTDVHLAGTEGDGWPVTGHGVQLRAAVKECRLAVGANRPDGLLLRRRLSPWQKAGCLSTLQQSWDNGLVVAAEKQVRLSADVDPWHEDGIASVEKHARAVCTVA